MRLGAGRRGSRVGRRGRRKRTGKRDGGLDGSEAVMRRAKVLWAEGRKIGCTVWGGRGYEEEAESGGELERKTEEWIGLGGRGTVIRGEKKKGKLERRKKNGIV